MSSKPVCELKIIVIGESGVGKTSLSRRFEHNEFKNVAKETVVVDFWKKETIVGGRQVKLVIYDTAGQERYKSLVSGYFRNVDGVLLVYDVTNIMTFNKISGWLAQAKELSPEAVALIVGNKTDHPLGTAVSRDTVRRFARDEGLEFMLTSAKEGRNVQQVFEYLTLKILIKKDLIDSDTIDSVLTNHESGDDDSNEQEQISSANVAANDTISNRDSSNELNKLSTNREDKQKELDLLVPSTSTDVLNSGQNTTVVGTTQKWTASSSNKDQEPQVTQTQKKSDCLPNNCDIVTTISNDQVLETAQSKKLGSLPMHSDSVTISSATMHNNQFPNAIQKKTKSGSLPMDSDKRTNDSHQVPLIAENKKRSESFPTNSVNATTNDTQRYKYTTAALRIQNKNQSSQSLSTNRNSENSNSNCSEDESSFVFVQDDEIREYAKAQKRLLKRTGDQAVCSVLLPPVVPLADDVTDLCLIRNRKRMSSDSLSSLATEMNEEYESIIRLHREACAEEVKIRSRNKCCLQ